MATFAPPAPAVPGLGARGGARADAWRRAWLRLSRGKWLDADVLAAEVGYETGLKPESVRKLLAGMQREGFLEKETRQHPVKVVRRGKSFDAHRGHIWYRAVQNR